MADDLERLLAQEAIVDRINDLFVGTDRRDWDRVGACFAPRVHFDMTSLAGGTPAELTPNDIVSAWREGLAPITAVHHQIGNHRVDVRGAEADAFCYGIAFHYRKTASGRNVRSFVGSYTFHLTRAAGPWQIDRFRFDCKFIDGNPALEKG